MTKLPDDTGLRRLYHDGLTDVEIAELYDVTQQAVNKRLVAMGIQRRPWSNTATSILEAAWPASETARPRAIRLGPARRLWAFVRLRLGDPTLSVRQRQDAEAFVRYLTTNNVVLDLDSSRDRNWWVYVPRTEADGRLVIRWPEHRERPIGAHLEAISLPLERAPEV